MLVVIRGAPAVPNFPDLRVLLPIGSDFIHGGPIIPSHHPFPPPLPITPSHPVLPSTFGLPTSPSHHPFPSSLPISLPFIFWCLLALGASACTLARPARSDVSLDRHGPWGVRQPALARSAIAGFSSAGTEAGVGGLGLGNVRRRRHRPQPARTRTRQQLGARTRQSAGMRSRVSPATAVRDARIATPFPSSAPLPAVGAPSPHRVRRGAIIAAISLISVLVLSAPSPLPPTPPLLRRRGPAPHAPGARARGPATTRMVPSQAPASRPAPRRPLSSSAARFPRHWRSRKATTLSTPSRRRWPCPCPWRRPARRRRCSRARCRLGAWGRPSGGQGGRHVAWRCTGRG
jgi:hypothetical protein